MAFDALMEHVVHGFEVAGVLVLVLGAVLAFTSAVVTARRAGTVRAYEQVRRGVGHAILLGLELLIIADIVLTITVDTTLQNVATLALIVGVRTFLSLSLEIELDGALPWQRSEDSRSRAGRRTT